MQNRFTGKILGVTLIAALIIGCTTILGFAMSSAQAATDKEVITNSISNNAGVDYDIPVPKYSTKYSELYDADGNLVYYHTYDEDGNDVYLDYVPEKIKGDAEMNGVYFISEIIDCVNGISGEHKKDNGQMAVYTNNSGTWSLKSGQVVTLVFDVEATPDEGDGWVIEWGYLKDGAYTKHSDSRLVSGEIALTFAAPEDGEYCFFFINASAGEVFVNSCTISD